MIFSGSREEPMILSIELYLDLISSFSGIILLENGYNVKRCLLILDRVPAMSSFEACLELEAALIGLVFEICHFHVN